jgi:hypothetical protein
MSSIITIQPCKFTNYPQHNVVTRLIEDGISYGYRIYDNYGSTYNNLWEKADMNLSPLEVLKKVYDGSKGDDTVELMFDFLVENELGIFVGNDWLEWDQIKEILT